MCKLQYIDHTNGQVVSEEINPCESYLAERCDNDDCPKLDGICKDCQKCTVWLCNDHREGHGCYGAMQKCDRFDEYIDVED